MLACPSCKAVNMKVSEIYSKKKGLASFLFFQCHSCNYFIESCTSRSVGKGFDINTRAVYSMMACGQGYAGLEKFVSLMNLPKPMTSNNYDKSVTKLIAATKEIAETTMQDHNAGPQCAGPQCRTTMQDHNAGPQCRNNCRTTMQDHNAGPQ